MAKQNIPSAGTPPADNLTEEQLKAQKEAEAQVKLDAEAAELKAKEEAEAKADAENLVFRTDGGTRYSFSPLCPNRFNFNGENKSKEEWLQDRDAMQLLISGRSSFIKQLKNK